MSLHLKSIKDPERLEWNEAKKVDHYYLSRRKWDCPFLYRKILCPEV